MFSDSAERLVIRSKPSPYVRFRNPVQKFWGAEGKCWAEFNGKILFCCITSNLGIFLGAESDQAVGSFPNRRSIDRRFCGRYVLARSLGGREGDRQTEEETSALRLLAPNLGHRTHESSSERLISGILSSAPLPLPPRDNREICLRGKFLSLFPDFGKMPHFLSLSLSLGRPNSQQDLHSVDWWLLLSHLNFDGLHYWMRNRKEDVAFHVVLHWECRESLLRQHT